MEAIVVFAAIYRKFKILPRGLADFIHFKIPFHKHLLEHLGAVLGNRENCSKLMKAEQPILVFPGSLIPIFFFIHVFIFPLIL